MNTTAFDPVAYLTTVLTELDTCAERAVAAARSGKPGDAARAARMMMSLITGRRDVLAQIETMSRSKRVPPKLRRAIGSVVAPRLVALERRVGTLKALLDARRERAKALQSVLRQSCATHSVYAAAPAGGARVVTRTTQHLVAISA